MASVRVLRLTREIARKHEDDFLFFVVLNGSASTCGTHGTHTLETDDVCVIPKGADFTIAAAEPFEVLEVSVR